MSEEINRGVKQMFEGIYEARPKKHAMVYAKLMKEYEKITRSMKEMAGKSTDQKNKESFEATKDEVSWCGGSKKEKEEDQEKMEQLLPASQSEKKDEDGQGKAEHDLSGSQRSKKKNEASGENEVKNKNKEVRRDEGQR